MSSSLRVIGIGEPNKVDGVRTQEVRIVYNFAGELYKFPWISVNNTGV